MAGGIVIWDMLEANGLVLGKPYYNIQRMRHSAVKEKERDFAA